MNEIDSPNNYLINQHWCMTHDISKTLTGIRLSSDVEVVGLVAVEEGEELRQRRVQVTSDVLLILGVASVVSSETETCKPGVTRHIKKSS